MTSSNNLPAAVSGSKKRARLLLLFAILLLLYAVGKHYGIAEQFDPQALRKLIGEMGVLGIVLYLLLFCAGLVLSVPGIFFMVASGLAWGKLYGIAIALLGANLAIVFSFSVVRYFHGDGFEADKVNNRWLKRMLSGLERHPIRNIAIMRCLISTAPGLNYGLALSSVTNRQHLVGTLIGTILPVSGIVIFSDWLVGRFF